MSHRWCNSKQEDLLWAEWDNEFIVYHKPSGKTHLVNALSRELIEQILTTPLSTDEIAGTLATELGIECTELHVANIAGLLKRLDELGLINSSPVISS